MGASGCGSGGIGRLLKMPTFGSLCSLLLVASILPLASATLANESAVLLSMKQAWGNPRELNSWSTSFPTCTWVFVVCDPRNTTILNLAIYGANVNSTLPASIGQLVNLEKLTVQQWGLIGDIPASITTLSNLSTLTLSSNNLSGVIPPEIGNLTKLTSLDLSVNSLTGGLPPELAKLRLLSNLNLGTNLLDGPLPSWIGSLTELTQLRLSVTNIGGSIPAELGNLTKLQVLDLSFSQLSGPLPPELGNLISITELQLYGNQFTGRIPDSYANLKSLTSLILYSNKLSGPIPSALGSMTNLTLIFLYSNGLEGSIPNELGNLSALITLDLHQNDLSGSIPPELGLLSDLEILSLEQNSLSGPIPTQLAQLSNVQSIDLSGNLLSGPIPPNITTLPLLKTLYLQNNCLNGTVPPQNTSNSNLDFNFGLGNNSNCFNATRPCKCAASFAQPPSSPTPSSSPRAAAGGDKGSSKTAQTVYIAVGVVAGSLIAIMALLVICLRRYCRPKVPAGSTANRGSVRKYTLAEITAATNNFTTQVGEGAFATVYKAVLKDGHVAAVKRFNKKKPLVSFEQEVELYPQLNHRFLLNLDGYCEEAGEYMLLFEFMDRGNLRDNLHGARADVPLTWDERVRILICVAHGIEYLHYGTNPPMFHRDIKAANILLSSSGSTLQVKLADFGLGQQTVIESDVSESQVRHGNEPPKDHRAQLAGSPGYYDPEYVNTGVLSEKSDVYSYGVVLLELITGKKSISERGLPLVTWAKPYLDLDREDVLDIIDPKLPKASFPEQQMLAVAQLARRCTEDNARERPTMRQVLYYINEVFHTEARMVNPSMRTASIAESSAAQSKELSKDFMGMGDGSIYSYTKSEILPRE